MARYKWDLYKDGITQSGLRKWMECREQFYLAYVEGWTAKEPSGPLDFGSKVHEILAKARGAPGKVEWLIAEMMKELFRDKSLTVASRESLSQRISVVEIMLRNYFWFWAKQDRKRKWKSREETFNVEYYPHGKVNKATGLYRAITRAFPLRGRKDGIYFFSRKECLQEVKTGGQIDDRGIQSSLHLMFQPMFYSYAHYLETGKVPHKILYDMIRRPSLRPRQNEDFGDFLNRLEEDVRTQRPAWYFMRWEVSLTEDILLDWFRRVLKKLLEDFSLWHLQAGPGKNRFACSSHYINPDALTTKGGGRSEFFDLLTRGSTYGLYRRDVPFPELED